MSIFLYAHLLIVLQQKFLWMFMKWNSLPSLRAEVTLITTSYNESILSLNSVHIVILIHCLCVFWFYFKVFENLWIVSHKTFVVLLSLFICSLRCLLTGLERCFWKAKERIEPNKSRKKLSITSMYFCGCCFVFEQLILGKQRVLESWKLKFKKRNEVTDLIHADISRILVQSIS